MSNVDSKRNIDLVNLASYFRKVEDLSRPPMGLVYVGSALKKAGYEVKIHHIRKTDLDTTCDKIIARDPFLVGFSSFTGPAIKDTVILMRKLKEKRPDIKIAWGGVHPSLVPKQCLEEEAVDFVCIGEGEETMVELADNLRCGGDLDAVKSLSFKRNGQIIINPERPLLIDLDKVQLDWALLDNLEQYVKVIGGKRFMSVITSRGCPHNCGFCYNIKFNKRSWRRHAIDFVIKNVLALREKIEFDAVLFDDDNFFTDRERGFEIIRALKKNNIDTDWLNIRVNYLGEEILDKIEDLEIKCLFIGWESGNDRLLNLINKQLTCAETLKKVRYLSQRKTFRQIDAAGIIGFPTETWEETKKTVDMALKISRILPNVSLMIQTYLPFPGTDLFSLAVKEGFCMPQNPMEWEYFDIIEGDFKITWLKNYPFKDIRKRFFYISKYVFLLNRVKEDSLILTLGKRIFYYLAYFRLQFQFFFFPWEIFILDIVSRWVIRARRKNAFKK